MANFLRYGGLRMLNSFHGGGSSLRRMYKDASQNLAIFRGDVVAREADTFLAPGGNLTPGTSLYDGVSMDYGRVSALTEHLICVDPMVVYEAQAGATGLVAADEGLNANFIFSVGSGEMSGHLINDGTEADTATLDLHLKEFLRESQNEEGAYSRWGILINKHRMHGSAAGV